MALLSLTVASDHFTYVVNVFSGIFNNYIFVGIWVTTAALQALMIEFGSVAFKVSSKGLNLKYWLISLAIGFGVLPWQQVINFFFWFSQQYKVKRNEKRKRAAGLQTVQPTG
jgi:Cation transporting ATPase, C-terminus